MNFDRIAPHYRWLEMVVFGNQLQRARLAFVREISPPQRVLIVGEGNGRFLAEFVRAHPAAAIDCVEASGRMIALTRRRGDFAQVRFVQADVREVALPAAHYDLIVTHFVLDCFAGSELGEVVKNLAAAAESEALWLLADFRLPRRGWRRWHAKIWICAMYLFFRLTSRLETRQLAGPALFLREHGFECGRRQESRFGMIQSAVWHR